MDTVMRRHAAYRNKHSLELVEEGYFQLPRHTKHQRNHTWSEWYLRTAWEAVPRHREHHLVNDLMRLF